MHHRARFQCQQDTGNPRRPFLIAIKPLLDTLTNIEFICSGTRNDEKQDAVNNSAVEQSRSSVCTDTYRHVILQCLRRIRRLVFAEHADQAEIVILKELVFILQLFATLTTLDL